MASFHAPLPAVGAHRAHYFKLGWCCNGTSLAKAGIEAQTKLPKALESLAWINCLRSSDSFYNCLLIAGIRGC